MDLSFFYTQPIWLSGVIVVVMLLVGLEVGFRVGLWQRRTWKDAESGGGNVVLTSLLALLGLILAFTYSSSVSRFDNRKEAVIDEANAIGTAFLRADLVSEPGRTELKEALLAYARTRVIEPGIATNARRREMLQTTLQAQERLWPITEQIATAQEPGPVEVSLVSAVNDVIDMHTVRLAALFDKLPTIVVWMLVLIAASSLTVSGFNAGISGRMSRWRMTVFALVLTGVMLVIVDFDRPNDGLVQVSSRSMLDVIADMEAELGR